MGKRRSIRRPSLVTATLTRACALFVFVVHTMNAMSGHRARLGETGRGASLLSTHVPQNFPALRAGIHQKQNAKGPKFSSAALRAGSTGAAYE